MAIIVDIRYKHLVLDARAVNDWIAFVRMDATPFTISIIEAYAPTSVAPDEEIENFYSVLEGTLA